MQRAARAVVLRAARAVVVRPAHAAVLGAAVLGAALSGAARPARCPHRSAMRPRRLMTSQAGPPRRLPGRHRVQAWSRVQPLSPAQAWSSVLAGLRQVRAGLRAQA
jgi:hypothetical protein